MREKEQIPEVVDNFRRIFQAVGMLARAIEKETELTGPQLWAVKLLAQGAPMRVSDLAKQMYLKPATVVGIVDRLEMKNLVTRNRSLQDRRAVDLELTALGKELAGRSPEVAQVMLVEGLAALSEEEFHAAAEGLRHVARILGAEKMVPQPLHC